MIKKLKSFLNDFSGVWVGVVILLMFVAGTVLARQIESAHKIATVTVGQIQVSVKFVTPVIKTEQMKQEIRQATEEFAGKVDEIVQENLKRPPLEY